MYNVVAIIIINHDVLTFSNKLQWQGYIICYVNDLLPKRTIHCSIWEWHRNNFNPSLYGILVWPVPNNKIVQSTE